MNVLSVFDGISCGQLALQRSGIRVNQYFSSEIDKYAIKVAMKNFPDTIQLGDIENWRTWNLPKIDLLIGGSPCQGFSNAGLGLNFEDPRSKLFFVYVDILNDLRKKNPDLIFLLENVRMKKEWRDIITEHVGVEFVEINSALVSAQNRKRLYWASWNITQPNDRHIYLKDIIEGGDVDREKSYAIDANYYKGGSLENYRKKRRRQIVNLPLHQSEKRLMVKTIPHGYIKAGEKLYPSLVGQDPSTKYLVQGAADESHYRKLTVLECERLQTIPEGYTEGVSNTQRYKMLGNAWTVGVVAHIFSSIPKELVVDAV